MKKGIKKVHLIGIGGSGMSGIAEVLINLGYAVSGSDIEYSSAIEKIESMGADVKIGHDIKNIENSEVLVYSSAIKNDNVELVEAKSRKLTVLRRAEMLSELLSLKRGVAVSGSHGKTTTTSMISNIFASAGLDPTFVVGGKVFGIGMHSKVGKGDFMIVEADESDGSFLRLKPDYCVVTNIDYEHLDYYGGIEKLQSAFKDFINNISFLGFASLCADDRLLRSIFPELSRKYFTYGINTSADYYAINIELEKEFSRFDVYCKNKFIGRFSLSVPGIHNIYNALASMTLALELGIKSNYIFDGLKDFRGVERRFQIKKEDEKLIIIDDYAHHPVEITATLKAAKNWDRQIIAVFQPHRYSRMHNLIDEFCNSLKIADTVIITDVYSAGEVVIDSATSAVLSEKMRHIGYKNIYYVPNKNDISSNLSNILKGGEMVIFLGAGDITKYCDEFVYYNNNNNKKSGKKVKKAAMIEAL
jgi:UDP-N-acetylmuramate--alanine ligase